ncbi:hypothetical protein SAMN05443661_14420 [Natronobacterium gregoryi]|uniref:Uncharacterized protein n=2 Tax=Natronobacterium gregoryi TaxID=44930 RepID=L0AKB3_NATGS|nr:hypothetical protein Natgr_2754 [Natronobacterium gregoryi SP2]ELY64856.1 hypothetical protein C490_14260 [Natronobacterium gregoryi SP2]PLK19164.1 hypothetical protein CYV19_16345 [Natronobacterium gregoryi SP2]SFJ59716.1 hypothetical protein SAMN05443661_14420 [Natronobacterium gregoryi]
MSGNDRSRDRTQDRAEQRNADRADRTESVLEDIERYFGELEYPVISEGVAAEYGNESLDMQNETESLGSVFVRLVGEEFDSLEGFGRPSTAK